MSKKYTTNFLEDTNGSTGTTNQVLVSTATGIDWVDGSGSGIIGGPYLALTGGTMTGVTQFNDHTQHGDQVSAKWGASNDLTIKHNATDSFVENYTGHLNIVNYADGKDIKFWSDDGSGGVATYFFVDTLSDATQFTKNIYLQDNKKALFGNSSDLQIYHDGSNSYIKDTGTGNLEILADSLSLLNAAGSEYYARFYTNGAAYLYHNGIAKLNTTSTGITVTGKVSGVTAGTANTDAVNLQQLNDATTGVLVYQGVWNASTNTPTLASATGTPGYYYIVDTDGSTNLDGITDWKVGDWAVFSDMATDAWQKIDNTSILGGAGTGGTVALWSGSGTSLTLGDSRITQTSTANRVTSPGNASTDSALEVQNASATNLLRVRGNGIVEIPGNYLHVNASSGAYIDGKLRARTGITDDGGTLGLGGNNTTDNLTLTSNTSATFAGDVGLGGTGLYTTSASLNIDGTGLAIKNDTSGSSNNWSIIKNSDTASSSNIEFITGAGTSLTLNHDTSATFSGDVAISSTMPKLTFTDLQQDDWRIMNDNGDFRFTNIDGSGHALILATNNNATFAGSLISANSGSYFRIQNAAGNSTYPTYSFQDDSNTGMMSSSTDSLSFVTGGSLALTLNASQNATFAGTVTAAVIGVDSLTFNGTEIDSSGSLEIDAAADITIDAGGGDIILSDDGTIFGTFSKSGNDLQLRSRISDGDLLLRGVDGGVTIDALKLDMSAGGAATFAGKLGIGITPVELLDIQSASGDARIRLDAPSGSDTEVKFFNAGVAQYTIGHDDATDNFVIGGANVDAPLVSVGKTGNATFTGDVTISKAATPLFKLLDTTNNISLLLGADDANTFIRSSSTANVYIQPGGSTAMTFKASGQVGIGTTAPDFELDVAGNIGMDNKLYHNGDHNTYIGFEHDNIKLRTGGVDAITVNSSQNVGIGTTGPAYKLDVDGDVQINETLIAKAGADLILQARSSQVVGINSNGARTMTLNASNNVGIGTTSPDY